MIGSTIFIDYDTASVFFFQLCWLVFSLLFEFFFCFTWPSVFFCLLLLFHFSLIFITPRALFRSRDKSLRINPFPFVLFHCISRTTKKNTIILFLFFCCCVKCGWNGDDKTWWKWGAFFFFVCVEIKKLLSISIHFREIWIHFWCLLDLGSLNKKILIYFPFSDNRQWQCVCFVLTREQLGWCC